MEHIQCPHCHRKYGVNDRIRAAEGKKIRCKACQQPFEIIIHAGEAAPREPEPTPPSEPARHDQRGESNSSPDEQPQEHQPEGGEKAVQTAAKGGRLQLLLTTILLSLLLLIGVGGYLYFNMPELFGSKETKPEPAIIPDEIVKPLRPMPEKTTAEPAAKPAQPAAPATTQPEESNDAAASAPTQPAQAPEASRSQACKQLLAAYWYRTNILTTTRIDTDRYMELLGKNLDQAEEIAQTCGDRSLISRIVESAKIDHKPSWIRHEIEQLIEADFQQQQTPDLGESPAGSPHPDKAATTP